MANGGGPHGPAKAKKQPSASTKKGKPATPKKPAKADEPKKKPG